jgi:hypothetical protein
MGVRNWRQFSPPPDAKNLHVKDLARFTEAVQRMLGRKHNSKVFPRCQADF